MNFDGIDFCDLCGADLYAVERQYGRCRDCARDAYEAGEDADGEDFRGDEAAGYAADCQDAAMRLK